jgi:hypothetical protein
MFIEEPERSAFDAIFREPPGRFAVSAPMELRRRILVAAAAMFGALMVSPPAPAYAAPAETAGEIRADVPYGSGDYTLLLLPVYTAALWTDAASWSMNAPFAITLQYDMSFSSREIVARAQKEMRHIDPALDDDALQHFGAELSKVLPSVNRGDAMTALYVPGKPVRFFKNGTLTGEVADKGFADDFFGIWLSPQTSAPSLRKDLLKHG